MRETERQDRLRAPEHQFGPLKIAMYLKRYHDLTMGLTLGVVPTLPASRRRYRQLWQRGALASRSTRKEVDQPLRRRFSALGRFENCPVRSTRIVALSAVWCGPDRLSEVAGRSTPTHVPGLARSRPKTRRSVRRDRRSGSR